MSASAHSELDLEAHQAVGTWRIVDPNPIWAIVSQPVLAPVFVITTRAAHVVLMDYYPLAVKRFEARMRR